MTEEDLLSLLSELESREAPLLSWGVTSASFTEQEILDLISQELPGASTEDVLDALLEQGLIVSQGISTPVYRTRMAETVRLAANLRQWFPGGDWRTARPLVSDLRFLSRTRTIPRREQTPPHVNEHLAATLGDAWTDSHRDALDQILNGRSIAAFQARALERIIHRHDNARGTVVTAGTGSGKTLAFYLPVLTHLMSTPRPASSPRVIAIYPRTELLRDQLRGLLTQTRSLSAAPDRLTVGVLYGATPYNRADAERQSRRGWRRRSNGLVSPILQCLEPSCPGDYIWLQTHGESEVLTCERCGGALTSDQLQFTRKSLLAKPPAILFTTTEMVNRQLGSGSRRLFVGDSRGGPEFLLLDEVHTYSGTHGAQVANLLRRWRSGFAKQPHIVGLSATLSDPEGFFATLTGLPATHVAAVGPQPSEMRPVGREYFLALRGDPASQTSLLSTTIQTAMLARRMLDLAPGTPSQGAFGTKLFVFTDDLDVTNRLHSQLEDAEGWRPGGVNRKPSGSLAMLRTSGGQDQQLRDQAGQLWAYAESSGTLQHPVRVSRTTSRDSGVDAAADIVVATASLEVGFDDPSVGAVLQHKAPGDAAQFLQRRGRAGRDPIMRPWTIVVLSDFGRDRLAFQSYEALFEPIVRAAPLPVRNRVILKMQATWHLADQLERVTNLPKMPQEQQALASRLKRALHELLTEPGLARFGRQLRWALAIDEEETRALMWDHPRGLVTAVVPTLLRTTAVLERGQAVESNPLRDFLPPSLFSALYTPEVQLELPHPGATDEGEPVAMAMRQFAPGRVSYRYALNGRRDRLWVEPPPSSQPDFELSGVASGWFDLEPPPGRAGEHFVQVTHLRLQTPTGQTSDSAYGRWNWATNFSYDGEPLALDLPAKTPWAVILTSLSAHTHRYRCPARIWRTSSEIEVERNDPQESVRTTHRVTLDGRPVSVGFSLDVDGIAVSVAPPPTPTGENLLRALRVSRMEYLIRTDDEMLTLIPSHFTREWLHQVLLSALVVGSTDSTLEQTLSGWTDPQLRDAMIDAAEQVFGADPNSPLGAPGLVQELTATLQDGAVMQRLRNIAPTLWAEPDASWNAWLQQRYFTTLGAAMVDAIQVLCPDVDSSSLRLDILMVEENDSAGVIRLTEDEPGGVGVVETFLDRYIEDPRGYWALVATALGCSDTERVDGTLTAVLESLSIGQFADEIANIRLARGLSENTEAWGELRRAMFEAGQANDPSITTALATRFLRPGSTGEVDTLALELLRMWQQLEAALGIEIELRVFAFVAIAHPDINRRLQALTSQSGQRSSAQIGQIVGLLWPRGSRVRAAALATYNPYANHEPTERLMLAPLLARQQVPTDASESNWREQIDDALRHDGMALLRATNDDQAAAALANILTEPTDVDVLEFHPRVTGVQRDATGIVLTLELREAHQ